MSTGKQVYAVESFAVGVDGATVWVDAGTPFAPDHPVVQAHPDAFTAEQPASPAPVEDKTVARGRGGRRRG